MSQRGRWIILGFSEESNAQPSAKIKTEILHLKAVDERGRRIPGRINLDNVSKCMAGRANGHASRCKKNRAAWKSTDLADPERPPLDFHP